MRSRESYVRFYHMQTEESSSDKKLYVLKVSGLVSVGEGDESHASGPNKMGSWFFSSELDT